MELTNQTQITIQNKVFTLGSPVTHADTLDQLLYVFQQQGIEQRPIVIINPVEDQIPNLTELLENYIANAMRGTEVEQRTSYMFQDATDEHILAWAESQYNPDGPVTLDYYIETGKCIRKQSQIKRDLDVAKARREELWRQHCLNPNSPEGSEEYSYITYNTIPMLESELAKVTEEMGKIPRTLDNGTRPTKPVDVVENRVEPVEIKTEEPDASPEEVGSATMDATWVGTSQMIMPISVAKNLADSPQYAAFKKQQSAAPQGYLPVPLEYLIAYGVKLYADGVPVVYTKAGRFMRTGSSGVSPLVNDYWYPTPRYV